MPALIRYLDLLATVATTSTITSQYLDGVKPHSQHCIQQREAVEEDSDHIYFFLNFAGEFTEYLPLAGCNL
ncbi:hypothetical protein TNCV_4882891 [Trichonephila clavipes]|nr:hypothetical protein TNCV_4882891 [Trichonephila clavipes]